MKANIRHYQVQKFGSLPTQNEDALWFSDSLRGKQLKSRDFFLAMTDGASESYLAAQWAKLLAEHACSKAVFDDFPAMLKRAHGEWKARMDKYLAQRESEGRPMQWYEEPGFERGAHATMLSVNFRTHHSHGLQWRARALGDTCVFHVRDNELQEAFPIKRSVDFSSAPDLVQTKLTSFEMTIKCLRDTGVQSCRRKDVFYLATDALACWLIKKSEEHGRPWAMLWDIEEQSNFEGWVNELRVSGEIRNDDTSLICLEVE